ncbi:hypothetical protein, partial [Paraburkholderia megapolitana]|uniref:hypothetical protein n=1 Tax=Paraburkholderia megapolitana TaxID=420953 RepID=UPI001C42E785
LPTPPQTPATTGSPASRTPLLRSAKDRDSSDLTDAAQALFEDFFNAPIAQFNPFFVDTKRSAVPVAQDTKRGAPKSAMPH